MKTVHKFLLFEERYTYDCRFCTSAQGWAQCVSKQDACYYGTWCNPYLLKIVNFAEGDLTVQTADSPEEFATAIRELVRWNIECGYWQGFDPGLDTVADNFNSRFERLGLSDLLTPEPARSALDWTAQR